MSLAEASQLYGIPHTTLCSRIKAGWKISKALITAPRIGGNYKKDQNLINISELHRQTILGVEYADQVI